VKRLSGRENWDYLYQPKTSETNEPAPEGQGRLPQRFFGSYSQHRYWSTIEKYLPKSTGQTILEIGCAPGTAVRQFERRFGCVPHGVEFSEPGVELTRNNFRKWGYNPDHITHADVFDPAFQKTVAGKFDIVMSGGFVEHFTDLRAVIDVHLGPLRPGGLLVITLPNYSGPNYLIGWMTIRHLFPMHNFEIMHLKRFREGCTSPDLQILTCGYYGGFDIGIFDTGGQTMLLKTFRRLQSGLNLLYRIVPPPAFRWTNSGILCIGRKLAPGIK